MTDDQIRKALDCCCASSPLCCTTCVLWQNKKYLNFVCAAGNYPWRKDLCLALEEAIRKNPEVFTSELVALVGKARVV